jgi:RNA polymerase sigma factor (sigma-70 family)
MVKSTGLVTDEQITAYEGLVCSTTELHVGTVNIEREDLRQLFRIKVWQALKSFNPERAKTTEQAYVFSCVFNLAKDLHKGTKYKPRPESYIEDLAPARDSGGVERAGRDRWEAEHGLSMDRDTAFAEVEVEREEVPIPNTLSEVETQVVCLLYSDYSQREIARRLDLSKRAMEAAMLAIRTKLADFDPGDGAVVVSLPLSAPVDARDATGVLAA